MGKIAEIFNFDNIGQKIKSLTKWSCWITILLIWIATPIVFIAGIINGSGVECILVPVAGVVASFVVWIGSWFLYAFGEITRGIAEIDSNTYRGCKKSIAQKESEREKIQKLEELRAKKLITEEEYRQTIEQMENGR